MAARSPFSGHYMRFPIVFGSVLAVFALGFSYRKEIFAGDIEALRAENKLNEEKHRQIAEELKRLSREQFARERERLMAAKKA